MFFNKLGKSARAPDPQPEESLPPAILPPGTGVLQQMVLLQNDDAERLARLNLLLTKHWDVVGMTRIGEEHVVYHMRFLGSIQAVCLLRKVLMTKLKQGKDVLSIVEDI